MKKIHTHLFCQTYNIYRQTKWLLSGSDLHFYHLVCLFKLSQGVTTSPMNPPKRNILLNIQFVMSMSKTLLATFKLRYESSTPASQKLSLSFMVCESLCKGLVTPDSVPPSTNHCYLILTQYTASSPRNAQLSQLEYLIFKGSPYLVMKFPIHLSNSDNSGIRVPGIQGCHPLPIL